MTLPPRTGPRADASSAPTATPMTPEQVGTYLPPGVVDSSLAEDVALVRGIRAAWEIPLVRRALLVLATAAVTKVAPPLYREFIAGDVVTSAPTIDSLRRAVDSGRVDRRDLRATTTAKLDTITALLRVLFSQNYELARQGCIGKTPEQWKMTRIPCRSLLSNESATWQTAPAFALPVPTTTP